jgi:two-component system OmpR family response regulator
VGHAELVRALAREGHDVLTIGAGARPIRFIGVFRPDVILLATPTAIDVCRELRRADRGTPIIALLAGDAIDDRVRALDAGADDCVSATVSRAELVARVHAVSRRASHRRGRS